MCRINVSRQSSLSRGNARATRRTIVQILWVYRCSSEYIAQNEKCLIWFFISTMVRVSKKNKAMSSSGAHLDIGEIDSNELASVLWV